jgi:hypothetical protein
MDPIIVLGGRLALLALFLASFAHKLRGWTDFTAAVRDYRLLPTAIAPLASVALLIAEAFAIVLLVIDDGSLGFLESAALLLAYAGAMAINLTRGRSFISCGCGGAGSGSSVSWALVTRNLMVAMFALLLAVSPSSGRALNWLDAVSIVGMLAVVALLYASVDLVLSRKFRIAGAR